jgi:hypothetical protein
MLGMVRILHAALLSIVRCRTYGNVTEKNNFQIELFKNISENLQSLEKAKNSSK